MPENWQTAISAYLQSIYDISGSEQSRETYRSTLSRFFKHCNKAPDDVSRSDVLAFIQSPSTARCNPGGEASASTKNQRLCVLTSFYRFASSYEINGAPLYQKVMPTQGMRYLKPDVPYRSMSSDELKRFFAAIATDTIKGKRDYALFALYFWTARRRNEVAAIQWRDIEPAIIERNGTQRTGHIYRYRPKGKHREIKTKELPPRAWQLIEQYLEASGRLFTMAPDDYIFISTNPWHTGCQPLHDDYINTLFKQYAIAAKLDANRLSVHSLRHAAARERYDAGADIRSIQQVLDHYSLQTTDRYLRMLAPVDDSGARLLEARYGL
jgi:integrase/recombinase XerD